ncbi:uncharacterized protein LOC125370321 [Ricinus communis]|uniref:uncharacterized protein LOC125370321 n=1 Tax=Ricinus communis TaxID=3988 RepID=UPI00201AE1F8|nr:uncharacterized protein LOC125370321 [Ricinus communis]
MMAFTSYTFGFIVFSFTRNNVVINFMYSGPWHFGFMMLFMPFLHLSVASYLDYLGPVVENHVLGPVRKFAMVVFSICAVSTVAKLVEDNKYCYVLIFFTVELQAFVYLLFGSRDHGNWDIAFAGSLQIGIINLMRGGIGNLLVAIVFSILVWRLVHYGYKSYFIEKYLQHIKESNSDMKLESNGEVKFEVIFLSKSDGEVKLESDKKIVSNGDIKLESDGELKVEFTFYEDIKPEFNKKVDNLIIFCSESKYQKRETLVMFIFSQQE